MNPTPSCAVIGYASLDNKFVTGPFAGVSRTTTIQERLTAGAEAGGSAYFARAIREHGGRCTIVTWVGGDEGGRSFVNELNRIGVDTSAVSQEGESSPTSYIFYGDDGQAVGYFEPGRLSHRVTSSQKSAVQKADCVVIGIGPREATAELLTHVSADAYMAWVVKADPSSLDPELAGALADRADLICLNRHETTYLRTHCGIRLHDLADNGTVIITTSGSQPSTCRVRREEFDLPAPVHVDVLDPTGAGDTFAASLAAQLASCPEPTAEQVRNAAQYAARDVENMLLTRKLRH